MASASSPGRRLFPLLPPPTALDPPVSSAPPVPPPPDLYSDPFPPPPRPPMSDDHPTDPSPASPSSPKEPPPAASSPPSVPAPAVAPPAPSPRRTPRFPRACNSRSSFAVASSRPQPQQAPLPTPLERRSSSRREKEESQQCGRVITPLAQQPESPSQLPRWELRSMWELASVLNFLHIFREQLNIAAEFSAEELETALITPNSTLDEVHMPLLKAIPPVTRMALGHATWVTVLCRKLKDWWHWVAEGDIPIVASHGTEIETYKNLSPGTRVLILKALCDIRVEQEDIRSHIDISLKRGIQLPVFRKDRIGGDSYGISYWYEDDPVIGHRLYREIRRVEVKKGKVKGSSVVPLVSIQWEAVATNLEEFQEVSEKLFESKNRSEASLGKKLKIFLPEIEKIHKKKERLLKKQHREALLLDSYLTADGLSAGRSLRDRKPVTYTFDDYDRSINEAIKITKKSQSSPENITKRAVSAKSEVHTNGKWNDPSQEDMMSYDAPSPRSNDYEETDMDNHEETLDRSNRRRKRPQRYSDKDYVEAVSDVDADYDSDDDIVGEAVYDEEYLRSRKQRKMSSGSDGDEEYHWEENAEDEEEEEYSLSTSEDAEEKHHQFKKIPTRSRRETKLRSVDELQTGLRRSRRSIRPRINYRQYEMSETDSDSPKPGKPNATETHLDEHSDASEDPELSTESLDSQDEHADEEIPENKTTQVFAEPSNKEQQQPLEKIEDNHEQEEGVVQKRRFLDLNELAPVTGFDDGPSTKDGDVDNF